MDTPAILLIALILDALLGEPRWLWNRAPHPVVLAGRLIDWADRHLNTGPARLTGFLLVGGLVLGGWTVGALISALPDGGVVEVLAVAILMAQSSLSAHVTSVARGLAASVTEGRRAVALIVGRDTGPMDEPAVARAAIESAAENLSDGVVAPALAYLAFGLPGIIVYKLINTADSMIGHRTPRHEAFGWAAARLDDVLNWIPARATAFALAAISGHLGDWPGIVADARRHRSPNAGWPEAALARAIGVALSGPRSYGGKMTDFPFVHPMGRRDPGPAHIRAAVRKLWQVWAALALLALALTLVA